MKHVYIALTYVSRHDKKGAGSGVGWSDGSGWNSSAGASYNLDDSRARAYCACSRCGSGLFGHFSLHYLFSSLSPFLWETALYRLEYCLKGPLNQKKKKKKKKQRQDDVRVQRWRDERKHTSLLYYMYDQKGRDKAVCGIIFVALVRAFWKLPYHVLIAPELHS